MQASFASMQLESDSQTLENPPRFNPLENRSSATGAEPTTLPAKGHTALARLRRKSGDAIEQLIALLDAIERDPDLRARREGAG